MASRDYAFEAESESHHYAEDLSNLHITESEEGAGLQRVHSPAMSGSDYSRKSSSSRSPLAFGLEKLHAFGAGRRTNRDGQEPKKRGPKPDSKPALTRRQELNRQAQRTHRERKESYIKDLENQVLRLKEIYAGSVHEKQAITDENRKLKELLRMHGIAYQSEDQLSNFTPSAADSSQAGRSTSTFGYAQDQPFSPASMTTHESHTTHASNAPSPADYQSAGYYAGHVHLHPQQQPPPAQVGQRSEALDYEQLGVDFVLALETVCRDHIQELSTKAFQDPGAAPAGHALMMSCPPASHLEHHQDEEYPHKSLEMPKADLMTLLRLSRRLPLDGELTPVMAFDRIKNDPRFASFSLEDFARLRDELRQRTKCYGFGAVMEGFHVQDAMTDILGDRAQEEQFQ